MPKPSTYPAENRCWLTSEYLTREEVADLLGVSLRTIDRWHAERIGPPRISHGKVIFYRKSALEKWLRSHEKPLSTD